MRTNEIDTVEQGKTYKFDDLIHDVIPTRFGEMHLLKLVKGDEIVQVLKAPKDLRTFLKINPEAREFTLKKVIMDGEYKNYIFN